MGDAIAAGKEIDFTCTRCKLLLAHTIIAVVNGEPARVKCNTCHTERKWRRARSSKRSTVKTRSRADKTRLTNKNASAFEKQSKWKALMEKAHEGKVQRAEYSIRGTFEKGTIVEHKVFGDGIVETVIDNTKIMVCFLDGDKLLVQGRN